MYSSVERVDLVLKTPQGGAILCQTDHRSPEEIAAAPELSVLFAVARIVNARRAPVPGPIQVAYFAQFEPPPFLQQAIALLGAELRVDKQPRALPKPVGELDALFGEAVKGLGERVRAERQLSFDVPSLDLLESELRKVPPAEEDEPAHWRAVFELGAFCAGLLAGFGPCRWSIDPKAGAIPALFTLAAPGAEARLDLMAKARQCIGGHEQRLSELVAELERRLPRVH